MVNGISLVRKRESANTQLNAKYILRSKNVIRSTLNIEHNVFSSFSIREPKHSVKHNGYSSLEKKYFVMWHACARSQFASEACRHDRHFESKMPRES